AIASIEYFVSAKLFRLSLKQFIWLEYTVVSYYSHAICVDTTVDMTTFRYHRKRPGKASSDDVPSSGCSASVAHPLLTQLFYHATLFSLASLAVSNQPSCFQWLRIVCFSKIPLNEISF